MQMKRSFMMNSEFLMIYTHVEKKAIRSGMIIRKNHNVKGTKV